MKKLMMLTVMVGVLLGGCVPLVNKSPFIHWTITPKIQTIDRALEINHIKGGYWRGASRNLATSYDDRIKDYQLTDRYVKDLKKRYLPITQRLTEALQGISIETIKQWFSEVNLPCKDFDPSTVVCEYLMYSYKFKSIKNVLEPKYPNRRGYQKLILTFTVIEDGWTLNYSDGYCRSTEIRDRKHFDDPCQKLIYQVKDYYQIPRRKS